MHQLSHSLRYSIYAVLQKKGKRRQHCRDKSPFRSFWKAIDGEELKT